MSLFKPREVLEAEHWLKLGNPRAAANALLRARQDHKDIVKCKHEVVRRLVEEAWREFEQGAILTAEEALCLAGTLVPLSGEDAVFAQKVKSRFEEVRLKEESLADVKKLAHDWLRKKQYQDVIVLIEEYLENLESETLSQAKHILSPIRAEAHTKAQKLEQLRNSTEEAIKRGELDLAQQLLNELEQLAPEGDYRYQRVRELLEEQKKRNALNERVVRAREAIQQRDLQRARTYWHKALELDPDHSEVRQLTRDLILAEEQWREHHRAFRVEQRSQRFVFAEHWLVISSSEVVLGLGRDSDVNVPLMGRFLHSQHVRILRDRTCYQLVPCLDKHSNSCLVYVNAARVNGVFRLQSGDIIALGEPDREEVLKFRFLQPVSGSGTAILQAMPDSTRRLRTRSVTASDVIFLDKEVLFAPKPGQEVHVVDRRFPCSFLLCWTDERLQWQILGGIASCDRDDLASASEKGDVCVPGTLYLFESINPEHDEKKFLADCLLRHDNPVRKEDLLVKFTEA